MCRPTKQLVHSAHNKAAEHHMPSSGYDILAAMLESHSSSLPAVTMRMITAAQNVCPGRQAYDLKAPA